MEQQDRDKCTNKRNGGLELFGREIKGFAANGIVALGNGAYDGESRTCIRAGLDCYSSQVGSRSRDRESEMRKKVACLLFLILRRQSRSGLATRENIAFF